LVAAAKFLVEATKNSFVVPNFVAVTKPFFSVRGLFSSVFSQFRKYQPSGNMKFYYLGISQSLNLCLFLWENSFDFSSAKFHSTYFARKKMVL